MSLFTDEELGIEPAVFPCPYVPNFLSSQEADDLFDFLMGWNYCEMNNRHGLPLRRKGVAWAYDPDHSQVRGTSDSRTTEVDEDDHCDGPILPSKDAPDIIRSLAQKLTTYLRTMPGYESSLINYLSVIKYPDQDAGIDWHSHSEDYGVDTPTLIVSTGAERQFFVARQDKSQKRPPYEPKPSETSSIIAEHGSLLVVSNEQNYTHWHAILKNEGKNRQYGLPNRTYGPRISINTKCLLAQKVFSIRERHPRWAVYVGCKKNQFPASIYANDWTPELGHTNYISHSEVGFREYAEKKWLDPAFRERAIKDLRGKHLLCWCRQDVPGFCHARVWLEIVNRRETI
jgi:hypothetical protein